MRRPAAFIIFEKQSGPAAASALIPDAAVHAVPLQVIRSAFEYGGLKSVGSLKLKVKERLERSQAVLFFRGNEDHRAGADLTSSFLGLYGGFAFHDEIEMLAIFVQVIWRRRALLVMHDPRQHVVDLGEFFVDEENPLAAIGQQPGQLIFVKNVRHYRTSPSNRRIAGMPV